MCAAAGFPNNRCQASSENKATIEGIIELAVKETNEAFAKLPEGTVETLLKPENKEKLAAILTYHVVAGKVLAADVKAGKVATVNGKEITISTTDGVMVDAAKVVKTDIIGTNGVIHVIDSVILPKD